MNRDPSSTKQNRLAHELSPYLQQHAHNPVDWHAWNDEALELAKKQDKPILLSIGYSACHWCHVMERESFSNAEVAAQMNALFVNIKVDREERPDLDQIYQTVVQLMGRGGGWPLTVFLMPNLKPFFGGTYFPPVERHGMPSFSMVLESVARAYQTRRGEIEQSANQITSTIEEVLNGKANEEEVPVDAVERCARTLVRRFDDQHGGFGGAPKFPNTMNLDVLLRAWRRSGNTDFLNRVKISLDNMHMGGIWDHLGFGFHRYSTDERWLVPHFEKMLYDNALLAKLYIDGWRATREDIYSQVAIYILEYVLREMRSQEGLFYSSQDADSEGEEGAFFVWSPEELEQVLGPEDAKIASVYYGVAPGGNFENGKSVLHVNRSIAGTATQTGHSEEEVLNALERAREKLFSARETREKPFRDEKIIASWNGLMVTAFAEVGAALGHVPFIEASAMALKSIQQHLYKDGVLHRVYKDGHAKTSGFLEDYASIAIAALDVGELLRSADTISFARALIDEMLTRFWDEPQSGFLFAEQNTHDLVVQGKDIFDNATPSGTSLACHALLRLHAQTGDEKYFNYAEKVLRSMSAMVMENPFAFGHLVGALDAYIHGASHVVILGEPHEQQTQELVKEVFSAYLPDRVVSLVSRKSSEWAAGTATSLLAGKHQIDDRPTAYVCDGRTCSVPVTDASALHQLLQPASQ